MSLGRSDRSGRANGSGRCGSSAPAKPGAAGGASCRRLILFEEDFVLPGPPRGRGSASLHCGTAFLSPGCAPRVAGSGAFAPKGSQATAKGSGGTEPRAISLRGYRSMARCRPIVMAPSCLGIRIMSAPIRHRICLPAIEPDQSPPLSMAEPCSGSPSQADRMCRLRREVIRFLPSFHPISPRSRRAIAWARCAWAEALSRISRGSPSLCAPRRISREAASI